MHLHHSLRASGDKRDREGGNTKQHEGERIPHSSGFPSPAPPPPHTHILRVSVCVFDSVGMVGGGRTQTTSKINNIIHNMHHRRGGEK